MNWIGRSARTLGVYQAVRYSTLFDWYSRVARSGHSGSMDSDRRLYRALFAVYEIRSVFDVGANVGDKARVFRELAERVVCVEADPEMTAILRYRFRNRPGVSIEGMAVGESIGAATLHRKQFAGFNTLSEKWSDHSASLSVEPRGSIKVPVTTLDQLTETHGRPDYVKIDVEGYELQVVRGLSTAVPCLSFEANLPVFRDETLLVIDRLASLDPAYQFNVRQGDQASFLLPSHVGPDEITKFVKDSEAATYDVFAMGRGPAPSRSR